MKITSKDIGNFKDQVIDLKGWVYNTRRSGKIGFLTFRDGFGTLQCIVSKNDIGEEKFELFKSLTQESSIGISGKVVENERAPSGFEILEDCCLTKSDLSNLYQARQGTGYVISLKKKETSFNNKVTYIYRKSDINPNHYSPVITLSSILGADTESPLEYLQKAKETYISRMPEKNCHFCDNYGMGNYPAARMQFEFAVELQLTYLGLVWQGKNILFHAWLILRTTQKFAKHSLVEPLTS